VAVQLSSEALKMLTCKKKVSIELDAETARLMQLLATEVGSDVPTVLNKLAAKYQRANWFQKIAVVNFLKGD